MARMAVNDARHPSLDDVQARRPTTHVSLSRVGVTGVHKAIRIGAGDGEQLFHAEIEAFVDLNPDQKGAHMSRFEEIVKEAIDEVVLGERSRPRRSPPTSPSACASARAALRAEVTITARYPQDKRRPSRACARRGCTR